MIDDGGPHMRIIRAEDDEQVDHLIGNGCFGKGVLVALIGTIILAVAGYLIHVFL